eukprot:TRINITY_DN11242_c0_g1_i3.p1 TRINITY_DN11242_c0_g1~~TRINITY_DN11242_c0_g1_i3.p1  ORF type:complete len:147 (-),score=3.11 TRINITY_DN11242_c0_g1_i3:380-820(-)
MTLDPATWNNWNFFLWWIIVLVAYELFPIAIWFVSLFNVRQIPITGKYLDVLGPTDIAYLLFNKLTTPLFILHVLQFCSNSEQILFTFDVPFILFNFVTTVPILFLVYDFFYVPFHYALHTKVLYPYIHKHHHLQNAPSRGSSSCH